MFNEYSSKRINTSNYRINNNSKQIQVTQSNSYRYNLISPKNITNRYRYEQEDQTPYMSQNQIHYRLRRPEIHFEERRKNDNTMKNLKVKPEYNFSGFNSEKDNAEKEKDFVQKSISTFTSQYQNKLNTNSYIIEKNNKSNLVTSSQIENEKKIINLRENKENKENNFRLFQGNKSPKNAYKNKPLIKPTNFNADLKIEKKEENSSMPVAQKICNIIIKGEPKKAKKIKVDKKNKKKNFLQNIEIEEKVAQGSAIPEKKINKNNNDEKQKLSSLPPKNDVDKNKNNNYNNNIKKKENEVKEKILKANEEKKPIIKETLKNVKKEEKISKNKEILKGVEKSNYNQKNKKEEIHEENEEEEIEEDQNQEEQENEDGEEHNDEENAEQYEEEENEGNNNKKDIEELEEEEHHTIQLSNKDNKKIDLKLQKENEIKLEGKDEKIPNMQIENFQVFQESNKKSKQNNSQYNIISDDNIAIIGQKKPLILEMNNESNIELIKNKPVSIIKIQKVQSLEQPSSQPQNSIKKQAFIIIKNRENDVDIIHGNEQILKMQKVQNFAQPRDKKRKVKNKNIKFKISKAKDNNLILEKITEEPNLIIEKAIIYKQQPKVKQKMKNKNVKLKISNSKDNNFVLEKIIEEPKLEIENPITYNEQPKEKKIIKKENIEYEISKIDDSNFMLEKIEKIEKKEKEPEIKIENVNTIQYNEQNKVKNKKLSNKNTELIISKIKDSDITLEKKEVEPLLKIENSIEYEQMPIIEAKNTKKNKYIKNQISKNIDGNIEIISIPSISMTKENSIELKNQYNKNDYKKSDFKKLKISKKNSYQYNSIEVINDVISAPEETRIIIEGKPQQKPTNITKREITYNYKSPITQNKNELSISDNITNTIEPTINNNSNDINMDNEFDNNNVNINNKIESSKSTSMRENINQQPNKNEEKKKYKVSTIVSSNLVQTESEENQSTKMEHLSGKNLLKENTNNFRARRNRGPSSNDSSKEKERKENDNSVDKERVKMSNMISPIKVGDNNNEDNNELGKKNQIITNKYVQYNKNNLVKNEDNDSGKTQSYYFNKTYNNKNGIPKTPVQRDNHQTNYNKSKSHTITIISYNQEAKNIGRTYISSKLTPRGQSSEALKTRDNNNSNISRGRTCHRKKNDNKRISSNSVNTVYISTNIRRNTIEDTEQNKSEFYNNSYTCNTFNRKNSEPKHLTNKNKIIKISNNYNVKENQNEVKTNINIINANSRGNSPIVIKNTDKLENKTIEPNNMKEVFNDKNTLSLDKEEEKVTIINNNEKEIINYTSTENKIEENTDKNVKNDENNNDNLNNISSNNESKPDYFSNNLDTFTFGNSELSEYTKSYLNSYMQSSRPELSDFSKQFLTSDYTSTNTTDRPELSNITRAYLISQTPIDDDK